MFYGPMSKIISARGIPVLKTILYVSIPKLLNIFEFSAVCTQ